MQPQPFGLYTLINRVNVGGMAEVFKACYYDGGQPAFAAIKRILPHLAQDKSFIEMFITEAHTAGRLTHHNIAQIIEQGEENGEYFISMEYIAGRDLLYLRHHLKERGMYFPPALAALVIGHVADALDYAHRMCDANGQHLGIIHRDVSPQNILISYEGDVKLIDFGIAKAKSRTQEHTRAGVLKGKFGYMAPEQVRGLAMDHRADIFALGTVFYELLTNQRLFMGESDIETIELVRQAKVSPASYINEWVPPMLDHIISKALQVDPNHRYHSAGEMVQDLTHFLQSEAPMTHNSTLRMWMQQEFSTYIAHEKAQDAYLIEQMLQNLEETDEIADSTSLISAEMIEQLNQYTASELYEGQGRLHEENTGPLPMNQRDTGPMEYAQEWSHLEVDTSTQDIPSQGILPQDTAFQETAPPQGLQPPITNDQPPTRRVSAEIFQDMQQRGFELPQSVEHLSYTQGNLSSPAPYPEVRSPQEIARQAQEDQMLENLLEESFEDDESGLIESPDLDQILSLSINQGGRSPLVQSQLARPLPSLGFPASPPASTSFGLPTPPNTTPAPPASTSFGFPTPPPAPPASTSFGLPTPPNTTPALAPAIGAPYAEVPPSPSDRFSQDDLTPPPRRRPLKSPAPHSQSNIFKGLAALIVLCLLGVGISSVLSPAERLIRVQVFPPQGATIQVGPLPLQPVSTELQISLSSAELITVRHPEFTQWQKEVDPAQLKEPYLLKIDLEETAPRVSLSVKSKTRGAEVWIFGRLRGTTPFTEDVPTNLRGEIPIEVRVPGKPPWKQLKKVGKDSMKAYAPL